jgi:MFS family permease
MNDTARDTTYNFTNGLQRAWDNTLAFVPNFLAFLLILIVGYFVAMILGNLLDKVLTRVGFDRMVERGGLKQALSQSGIHVSDILGKLVFYTIFLFVLQLAFGVFGPNPISDLLTRVIAFLPNIFVAVVIVVISAAIAQGVKDIIRASIGGLSYGQMLANFAGMAILIVGAFAALNQLNIAPQIVNGLFYAMLAIVVGVSIVAIGGGGIQPMRSRWENALNRIDREVPVVVQTVQTNPMNQAVVNQPVQPVVPVVPTNPNQGGYVS